MVIYLQYQSIQLQSSVFEVSRFGGSIALEANKLKSNFLENENSEKESTLHYQAGIVYVFKNYSDGKLDKFSFGINYQTQNSFNDRHLITGQSDKSVDEFFYKQLIWSKSV